MLEQTRKFYIMERTDNNGALTFYLNEVGESKNAEKFKDFKNSLQKFVDSLKDYTGKALVYFHANWTYKGFATIEQAKKIIETLTANNVENKNAVEYIVTNKLISPLATNKDGKKVIDSTMVMAQIEFDLERKAKDVIFKLTNPKATVENIVIEDITTEEMKNYKVDIVKLERNFDSIDVSYNLIHDKYKSQLYIKTLSNLGKNLEISKARTINEDIEIKEHQQYVEVRNFKTKVWISVSILIALAILPISINTIITNGSSVATNLIGSIYIISSFFLMKILQGVSPLASAPHIIWYRNFEGVQNNENIYFMIANVVLVFVLYLMITLNILKRQDL